MEYPQIIVGLGVALTLLWGLSLLLLRDRFGRISEAVDRIPAKEWFDRVEQHMAQSEEQLRRLAILEYRADEAKARDDRERDRLGKLEADVSSHRERINSLDRRQDTRT